MRGKRELPSLCCYPPWAEPSSLSSFVLFSSWSSEGSQMWFRKPPGKEELGEGSLNVGMGCEGIGKALQHWWGTPDRSFYVPEGSWKGQTSFPR